MKERKTKIGKLLQSITLELPEFAGDVLDVVTSPNPAGAAVNALIGKLQGPDGGPFGERYSKQLEGMSKSDWQEYQLKEYELQVRDRASARSREVELAKTDKTDWMMYLVGIVGLGSFMTIIYAVIWVPGMDDNKLFIHLIGIIEGVVVSIFAYYFGTSKSSADKTKMLGK